MGALVTVPVILPPGSVPYESWDPDRRLGDSVFVVDNTTGGTWARVARRYGWRYVGHGSNAGVARSWNVGLALGEALGVDLVWLVSTSARIPGGYRTLLDAAEQADEYGLLSPLGFHAHAWRPSIVETIGAFDPVFSPAYFEDNDWVRRLHLAGLYDAGPFSAGPCARPGALLPYVRDADRWASLGTAQALRAGLVSSDVIGENQRRYVEKWGGTPGSERFVTPYGDPDLPLCWIGGRR